VQKRGESLPSTFDALGVYVSDFCYTMFPKKSQSIVV